jgi:16S rRNA (cytosine1402-N4)-methyltransferase
MNDAPLDMRMSPDNPFSALTVVNDYPEDELIRIFRSYGEERFAKRIAQRIVKHRGREQITTTGQLVEIIKKTAPSGWQRIHPATRVFQALRIEVNKELANLEKFLAEFPQWLNQDGRVGIISFHSLEDRLVKRSFRKYKEEGVLEIVTKKPVIPTAEEAKQNPRSRSAKFRVAIKV